MRPPPFPCGCGLVAAQFQRPRIRAAGGASQTSTACDCDCDCDCDYNCRRACVPWHRDLCPSLHALGAPVSGRLQSKWWWWWWSRTRPNARKVWGLVITHLRYVQSRRGACPSRLHNKGQQHRPRTDFWTVFAACWRMKCLLLNAPNAGEMCRSPKTHHYTAPHTTRPAA